MTAIRKTVIQLISLVFFAISSTPVHAGNGMSEEQMQQMMKHAEQMQKCLGKVDQGAMQELEAKSEKMQAEVRALCDAGKRDQATNTAIRYGKEISNSAVMRELMQCGEMAKQMMEQMSIPTPGQMERSGHICDGM